MADGLYDTPRAALEDLTDYPVLERVAVEILQRRGYPDLTITESSSDLGRDGFVLARYGEHDETVLLVSARKDWTTKLDEDLDPHLQKEPSQRPNTAVFVTSRTATEKHLKPRREKARAAGVALDVWTQSRLALELEKDDLRPVAVRELHVRPAMPGALFTAGVFQDRTAHARAGFTAEVVGRDRETEALATLLSTGTTMGRAPVVMVVGAAGVGKTRMAVDLANEHAATLVAPARVSLRREDLVRVPLDGPATLVVDDAHRGRHPGLPALLFDPTYDRVAVVLTVRPGREQNVLEQLGIEPDGVYRLRLREIGDREIDQIVQDYGITDEPFRRHVISAARGIPLVAHEACTRLAAQGSYFPAETAEILGRFVRRRLEFLDDPRDPNLEDLRRAVAVAVAAYAGARRSGRAALAALAPAITSLPPEQDRLDSAVNDLFETGLIEHPEILDYPHMSDELPVEDSTVTDVPSESKAELGLTPGEPENADQDGSGGGAAAGDTPDLMGLVEPHRSEGSHVIRPDAAGPVLLADALASNRRVRLDLAALLPLLGQHAAFNAGAARSGAASDEAGRAEITSGLGLLWPRPEDQGLNLDVAQLAAQLGVLAQAVDIADHRPGRTILHRVVTELTEASPQGHRPNVDAWSDIVILAGQAAAVAPGLITDLRAALMAGWPPEPSPRWWSDEDPETWYRGRVDRLLRVTAEQVRRLEHHGPELLMAWVLDTAWLANPVIGDLVHEPVRSAAKALSTTRVTQGVDTDDAILGRRAALRAAITSWVDARLARANDKPSDDEQGVRPPATALLLATIALEPLLSVLTEEVAQVPAEPGRFVLTQRILPDTAATAEALDRTIDTLVDLLDRLLTTPVRVDTAMQGYPDEPETLDVLRRIVARPQELVAEGARGTGGDTPLPAYALDLLRAASDRLAEAIARRWERLPLLTRHAAARAAVRRANIGQRRTPASGRDVTLSAVAGRGDPVAAHAANDANLAHVLTLLPVDDDLLAERAGHGPATIPIAQHEREATDLGAVLRTAEALALLRLTSPVAGSVPENFLIPFAAAAGAAATDPDLLIAELGQHRFYGDAHLLGAAMTRHGDVITKWLLERVDLDHANTVELALTITPELPTPTIQALHQRVLELVSSQWPDVAQPRAVQHIANHLAISLGRSSAPTQERLLHLGALGLHGPSNALGQVAMSIGQVLRQTHAEDSDAELHPISGDDEPTADLRRDLVAVLHRTLDRDDARTTQLASPSSHDEPEVAYGAVALLTHAPHEMAQLFLERTRTHPRHPVPTAWLNDLTSGLPKQPFAEAADALEAAANLRTETGAATQDDLTDETQRAINRLLRALRGDTTL